ncbi:MAG: Fic family protein [Actinomycetota bacterium]|nr:Fic family protein [Actinomycetota bacterium]
MRRDDFSSEAPGRLVSVGEGRWAFVPAPLPPKLSYGPPLIAALSEADRALGELAGLGRTLPNPYLLTRPFLRREAVLSSRIEGTRASLVDLYAFEAEPPLFGEPERRDDVQEVQNYVRALEHGMARLEELPISQRLLREMHAVLMEGVRGQQRDPGEFRRILNWIGPPGAGLDEATYVPPPTEIPAALSELERYIHGDTGLPPLLDIALVHYQFEAIHPFLDGNGRIGRLLITLMLIERDLLSEPLLYLSAYFERHRGAYYDHLLAVSQKGDWERWLLLFLRGVSVEARDASLRAGKLFELREAYRERFQREGASPNLLTATNHLFANPVTSIRELAEALGVSFEAARRLVGSLEERGVLEEITGRRRNRVYAAREVVEVLQEPLENE